MTVKKSYRISPCKDCGEDKRHSGCHDECPEYKAYKESIVEMKEAKRKSLSYLGYVRDRKTKEQKRKK